MGILIEREEVAGLEVEKLEESKQILIAVTELQTNMRNMSRQIEEISKISNLILETDQRAKSAHNRIGDLKLEFTEKMQTQKEDYEEKIAAQKERLDKSDENITWLKRAVIGGFITGGIGLIFGILLFLITKGGN